MVETTERRVIEFNAAELAEIVTRCFEGYIVPFVLEAGTFERRFRPEGLDSQAGIILMNSDEPAGVCLIARQGWTSRVAAMAIAPAFRSQGVGKYLMNRVIDEAKARGDKRMVLEVVEQNPPAIGLYESVGMRKTRRLVGWRREGSEGIPIDLTPVDPAEIVRSQVMECSPDLPWDYKPETLALKINTLGLSLEDKAFAILSDTPERVIVWSLFVVGEHRGKGYGRKFVEGIAARFPGKAIVTPVALPDDHADVFLTKLGFKNPDISQFEMAIDF